MILTFSEFNQVSSNIETFFLMLNLNFQINQVMTFSVCRSYINLQV